MEIRFADTKARAEGNFTGPDLNSITSQAIEEFIRLFKPRSFKITLVEACPLAYKMGGGVAMWQANVEAVEIQNEPVES